MKDPKGEYKTLADNQQVYIHPCSALFHQQPEWVIYHETAMTWKECLREVTTVDPTWLVQMEETRAPTSCVGSWARGDRLQGPAMAVSRNRD
jgi:HrpA-like RNA helicase